MKPNIEECKKLARDIVGDLYERGYGTDEQLQGMTECAESVIADKIEAHDRELLELSHYEHVEAAKRCGE